MIVEVNAGGEDIFLSSFAKSVGSKVENGKVVIPVKYGKGYVFGYLFKNDIQLIIRNYWLNNDIVIRRDNYRPASNMVLISFHHILKSDDSNDYRDNEKRQQLPSVVVTTRGFDPEIYISGNTSFNTVKLAVNAAYIRQLLGPDVEHEVIRNIIENSQPLVFEQFVSLKLEQIAAEIADTIVEKSVQGLFYKIKSEEMICYLLMELMQRQAGTIQALNAEDIRRIYAAREKLVEDLSAPPTLSALAGYANLSLSKLKRLFKQVYGKNVYQYFQEIRMKEAAYLLKHKRLSVSEVGYALGFSNLSHFSRKFEEYIGVKPKKYSIL